MRIPSDLDLALSAMALALDTQGLDVVQSAIKQRGCEDCIVVEDGGPLLLDPVGGDQGGAGVRRLGRS